MMPFENRHTEKILSSMTNTINVVMKGYLFIAIVQGFLMGIGLYIFGIPNPALWGTVAGFMSLIPFFGTATISIPAILYLFVFSTNGNAIGLLVWSLILVGTIDNFLNPLIIGTKTELPPLLVLFSVLGGISLVGPIGILIGPLAMNLFRTLILIYREEPKLS
jgi:predicted PurR-regulated permease PerM